MWRASMPPESDCRMLARVRQKLDLTPLVIHDNYLINLASIDPAIRSKSIACFRGELERAVAIGPVPGSASGQLRGQTLKKES
jgi:deoxyribonuclease-4